MRLRGVGSLRPEISGLASTASQGNAMLRMRATPSENYYLKQLRARGMGGVVCP